jgi:hypothetical protein
LLRIGLRPTQYFICAFVDVELLGHGLVAVV